MTEQMITSLERAESLDSVAAALDALWSKVLRRPALTGLLSGKPLGHPLHPAAVLVPAGSLLGATALDLLGGEDKDVRRLTAAGLLSAVPAALAGWSDWLDTEEAEKRVGLAHAATNVAALVAYAVSLRRSSRTARLAGAAALGVGGWLGGHLVFARGVGVDTTAFQVVPTEWTDVVDSSEVDEGFTKAEVAGMTVLLTKVDGDVVALAERCTHRGAPLSEGERQGDCVICPWHQSSFDLRTGAVRTSPATRPQATFEVRERQGKVQIRRREVGSLRTNPSS